jgi:hypothetical protein
MTLTMLNHRALRAQSVQLCFSITSVPVWRQPPSVWSDRNAVILHQLLHWARESDTIQILLEVMDIHSISGLRHYVPDRLLRQKSRILSTIVFCFIDFFPFVHSSRNAWHWIPGTYGREPEAAKWPSAADNGMREIWAVSSEMHAGETIQVHVHRRVIREIRR